MRENWESWALRHCSANTGGELGFREGGTTSPGRLAPLATALVQSIACCGILNEKQQSAKADKQQKRLTYHATDQAALYM